MIDTDKALAIAEDAFRSGYCAGLSDCGYVTVNFLNIDVAWAEYNPPEDIKMLIDKDN